MKHFFALLFLAGAACAAELQVTKAHDRDVLQDAILAAASANPEQFPDVLPVQESQGKRARLSVTSGADGSTVIRFPNAAATAAIQALIDAHDKAALDAARASAATAAQEKAAADATEKAAELQAAKAYWSRVKNSELGRFLRIVLKHGVKLEELE